MSREPGTRCELRVESWYGPLPEIYDQLYTAAGSAYLIVAWRPARPGSKSLGRFICERLPHGSVTPGAPGTFGWTFAKRVKRR